MESFTDYERPVRKLPPLHGRKFNPNPKSLGTAEAYFVCHIGQIFQISLIYAFIGCPYSVESFIQLRKSTCLPQKLPTTDNWGDPSWQVDQIETLSTVQDTVPVLTFRIQVGYTFFLQKMRGSQLTCGQYRDVVNRPKYSASIIVLNSGSFKLKIFWI